MILAFSFNAMTISKTGGKKKKNSFTIEELTWNSRSQVAVVEVMVFSYILIPFWKM